MNTKHLLLASLLAAFAAAPVLAQKNTIKIGVANVQPHSSASDFSGPFTPSGISVEVRNKTTSFFSYTREINDQWDIELALGDSPTHDIALKVNNPGLPARAQALTTR
ncbi:MAG: hypothetical protein ABIO73_12405 [Polaromonas sp.]